MGASMPKELRKGTPSTQFKTRIRMGFAKWVSAPATARDAVEAMEFLAWLSREGKLDTRPLRPICAAFFAFISLEYMGYTSPKISKLAIWTGSHPRGVRIQLAFLADQFPLFQQRRILVRCFNQGWQCFSSPSDGGLAAGLPRKKASRLRKDIMNAFNMEMTWTECTLEAEGETTRISADQFRPLWGSIYTIHRAQRTPDRPRSALVKRSLPEQEKPPLSRAKESASDVLGRPYSTPTSPSATPITLKPVLLSALVDSQASRSSDSIYSKPERGLTASDDTNASSSNTSSISTASKASFRVLVLDPPTDLDFLPDRLFSSFTIFDDSVFHHLDYLGSHIEPGDSVYYSAHEIRKFIRNEPEMGQIIGS